MDTAKIKKTTNNGSSWKFLIAFRAISIFFAAITAITFTGSLSFPVGIRTFLYISYMVLYVMLIYGFWNMRKWVITLMGCTIVLLTINNLVRLFYGTQKIGSALMALSFVGAILLFSYISRFHLNGEYKNIRVIRVFIVFLVLSQILLILLNK